MDKIKPINRPKKKNLGLIFFCLAIQILFGIVFSRTYLLYHNTLYNNGNWISTKYTMEKAVMGAIAFLTLQQSLAKGRLNLGAWFGFQEVIYKDKLNVKDIELDFILEPNAYFSIIVNKDKEGYNGIRLSVNDHFKSIFFTASDVGQFREKTLMTVPGLQPDYWHHLKISVKNDRYAIFLDDKKIEDFTQPSLNKQSIGFRGGQRNVSVDNIVIHQYDSDTIYESFNYPKKSVHTTIFIILATVLLNAFIMILFLLITKIGIHSIAMGISMVNMVLIFISLFGFGFQYFNAKSYPVVDNATLMFEEYWVKSSKEEILSDIKKHNSNINDENNYRILFVGSSQTWGAGAAKENDTFVHLVEDMLNHSTTGNTYFECINAGISGTRSSQIMSFLEKDLLPLKPRMVVINLSNNDIDVGDFAKSMEQMARTILSEDIYPVFVLEPNSIERTLKDSPHGDLLKKHEIMKEIAAANNIPVIDMHNYLLRRKDEGFLWWDFVHLTSFGHKLFAEGLYRDLAPLLKSAI